MAAVARRLVSVVGVCGRGTGLCSRCSFSTAVVPRCRPYVNALKLHPRFQFVRYKQTLAKTDAKQADAQGNLSDPSVVVEEISALNGVARKVSVDPSDGSIVDTDRNRLREASAQDPVPFVKKSPCTAVGNDVTFSDDPLRGAALSSEADEVKRRTRVIDPQTEAEAPPSCAPPAAVDQKWKPVVLDRSQLLDSYLKLSKIRLTGLVVLTTMAGYTMAPGTFHLSTFALCTLGTGLQSASANAINQFLEVPYDSQMNRTKNRPIIRGLISPLHAVSFAAVTGSAGLCILLFGVNPLTAGLGMANLVLYTCVYTPLKRLSIANTWLGSFVGAVPPMMGWAACAGQLDPGAWLLGGIMYAWQFPHFNALSWNLRADYSRAGYRMTAVVDPALCKRVALRYCVGLTALCTLAPLLELTTPPFALVSLPLNLWFTHLAYRFYRDGDSSSSRRLFRFSLLHIPLLVVMLLVTKQRHGDGDARAEPAEISETSARTVGVLATKTVGVSS